jgi:hypothetical protein
MLSTPRGLGGISHIIFALPATFQRRNVIVLRRTSGEFKSSRPGSKVWQGGRVIKLYYAGGSVEVGDDVAEVVMDYAHALADVGKSDLVKIPVTSETGTRGVARLLIGPSSELMASPVDDNEIDLTDPPLLEELRGKIARLQPQRAIAGDPHTLEGSDDL